MGWFSHFFFAILRMIWGQHLRKPGPLGAQLPAKRKAVDDPAGVAPQLDDLGIPPFRKPVYIYIYVLYTNGVYLLNYIYIYIYICMYIYIYI